MAKSKGPKFYAVARGTRPGIYYDWDSCKLEVDGFKNAKFKSFPTKDEAARYVKMYGDGITNWTALNSVSTSTGASEIKKRKADDSLINDSIAIVDRRPTKTSKVLQDDPVEDGFTIVWTDGSSRGNGTTGAVAGLGVYFGPNDSRNLAERLAGPRQTNQRAELTAIIRALQVIADEENVIIKTDSQYSINCFTVWNKAWALNGWKNSKKQAVENKDLVQKGLALIEKRTGQTELVKVRAHIGIVGNEMADQLANEGAMKCLPRVREHILIE